MRKYHFCLTYKAKIHCNVFHNSRAALEHTQEGPGLVGMNEPIITKQNPRPHFWKTETEELPETEKSHFIYLKCRKENKATKLL